MSYPQDVRSRHVLNRNSPLPSHWALAVVVEGRVVELQRWEADRRVASDEGPQGALAQFGTTSHRLVLYLRRKVWEWNPKDGALLERAYEKGEAKAVKDIFQVVPGEPQFRAQGDWCVVIIDGDVKACPPRELFLKAQEQWNGLPSAKKAALLGKPALEAFGGHFRGALRLLKYAIPASLVIVPLAWYLYNWVSG